MNTYFKLHIVLKKEDTSTHFDYEKVHVKWKHQQLYVFITRLLQSDKR